MLAVDQGSNKIQTNMEEKEPFLHTSWETETRISLSILSQNVMSKTATKTREGSHGEISAGKKYRRVIFN